MTVNLKSYNVFTFTLPVYQFTLDDESESCQKQNGNYSASVVLSVGKFQLSYPNANWMYLILLDPFLEFDTARRQYITVRGQEHA